MDDLYEELVPANRQRMKLDASSAENRKWVALQARRRRIATAWWLQVEPSPQVYCTNGQAWSLRLATDKAWQNLYPFALVTPHLGQRGLSVTLIEANPSRHVSAHSDHEVRTYLADRVFSFGEACAVALPELKVRDAAYRLAGSRSPR